MNETSARQPNAIVIAGINGAGKTTASRALLADTLRLMTFVNADVIAQGLSGFDPEAVAIRAGQIMLERLQELASERADFAFETTLAARSYAGWLDELRQSGYRVHLYYFWLRDPSLAVARVLARVQQGGHHVPEATIRQRYGRSIRNLFDLYTPVVTTWHVHDNSADAPRLIAEKDAQGAETVLDPETWDLLRRGGENG